MSFRKSNFIGASPAYTGVVAGSSVAVTSIHPSPLSSPVPGAQQVAIAPLERRTRDDEAHSRTLRLAQSGRDLAQPAVAVGVGQRYPSGHALHIVRGMQVITLDELDVECASELRSDQALAGAADAHHHVEPSMHSAHDVAPIVYCRGIRGYRLPPWTARPARV